MIRRARALSLFTILALLLLLSACAPTAERDPFAYANSPFSLSVEGTYLPASDPDGTPRPFAAEITADAPVNGDPTLRTLTVTFTAPKTLVGVTITAKATPDSNGTVAHSVTFAYPSEYGKIEVTAKGEELDGLLRFVEAWLPIGDVTEVSPEAADGSYTVTRRSGEREAVFTFTRERPLPLRVVLRDGQGTAELTVR